MNMYYDRNPWKGITTVLHFSNMACVALYKCELEGQISDGLYENRMPEFHWKWVCGAKPSLDTSNGLGYILEQNGESMRWGQDHVVRYSLRSLISHIGKNDDWGWTERILTYGKLGTLIPESQLETFWKEASSLRVIVEDVLDGHKELDTVEKVRNYIESLGRNWMLKYLDCTLLTDDLIKRFHESTYSLQDLKHDANLMSQTVNSRLY